MRKNKLILLFKICTILLFIIYFTVYFVWIRRNPLPSGTSDVEIQRFMFLAHKRQQLTFIMVMLSFVLIFLRWLFRNNAVKKWLSITLVGLIAIIISYFLITSFT